MHIVTKVNNLKLSPELSEYFEKKMRQIKKVISQNEEAVAFIDGEFSKSTHHRHGDVFKVEVNYCIAEKCYRATAEKSTLYEAMDEVKDSLMTEIRSVKIQKAQAVRRGGAKIKEMLRGYASPRLKS